MLPDEYPDVEAAFKILWADHGDVVSTQYAGTPTKEQQGGAGSTQVVRGSTLAVCGSTQVTETL